jgi:hypothetical protein
MPFARIISVWIVLKLHILMRQPISQARVLQSISNVHPDYVPQTVERKIVHAPAKVLCIEITAI